LLSWCFGLFVPFYALKDYLKLKPRYSDKPIDSFIQVIMIVLWIVGITIILSRLFEIGTRAFDYFWGCICMIILIFRDIILGFVASVQVSINDMIRIGDWITMGKIGGRM
jgi:miniconductance mechanosensitive channel